MNQNRWTVVFASLAALAVSSTPILFYTQSLFLAPMTQEFGWTRSGYFSALLAGGTAGAVATPLVGRLLDRFGVRPVLFVGIPLFALLNAAFALLGSSLGAYVGLSALVAIAGVAHGPLTYSKTVASWFDRKRGLALAVALSGTGLGGVIVPPLTAWMIATHGWRGARLGLGLLILVVALPVVFASVRERGRGIEARTSVADELEGISLRQATSSRSFWLLIAAFLISSTVVNGALANLAPIVTWGGQAKWVAPIALSAMAAGQIAGRFGSGLLLDRVLTARIGALWYGVAIVGLALLAVGGSTAILIGGSALVGAAVGAELEMAAVFTSRFFGRRHFGAINGAVFAAYLAGAASGPILASSLVTGGNDYHRAIHVGIGGLAVAAAALMLTEAYRYLPSGED